ncbi:MAG: AmmeMemoRadiSam system radical SAM enzyme [Deltaproteobacteria bacterium]|nr:AmmeMemoRadiSam system radical SAM enzyme [Deltaproteobacteria bacterium]
MSASGLGRRGLLGALVGGAGALCLAHRATAQDGAEGAALDAGPEAGLTLHPARWWKDAGEGRVACALCPNECRVADRERGSCGVRENRGGKYYSLVYARPCSVHVDPIEKKPFYHVLPGQTALSLGNPGCNMQCKFCQNWEISQVRPEQVRTLAAPPHDIVALARRTGSPTIACTYSEPVVWAEYVYDIGAASRKAGVRTLLVSNGFILPQPMNELGDVLGAVKIDLKAMDDTFYRDQCGGRLAPVLDTLRLLAKRKIWTEIVVLLIPGLNDGVEQARAIGRFVRAELGPEVPVHFTRFHPSYRLMNVPATPVATLTRARDAALGEGLHFVYVGNVLAHPGNNTYCPGCRRMLIRRLGMAALENRLKAGRCPDCGRAIPGIWA